MGIVDKEPKREIYVDTRYRIRFKKHEKFGGVSTYPTTAALEFMEQVVPTLPGLEEIHLCAGYLWDSETREVGSAVLSLRDGIDHVVWMCEIPEPGVAGDGSTERILPPTEPRLPVLEIRSPDVERRGTEDE